MKSRWAGGVIGVLVLLVLPALMHAPDRRPGDPPAYDTWLAALIDEGVDRGFERQFVEDALGGLQPLPRIVQLDRMQAQAPPDLELYLAERVTPELVSRGRELM